MKHGKHDLVVSPLGTQLIDEGVRTSVDTPLIIPGRCLKTVPKKTSVPGIIFEHIIKLYYT